MELIITGSAFDTGISIKNHIKEKVDLLLKKLKSGNVHKIHLVLNKDGINFLCKIDIIKEIGAKPILHASSEASDAYPCVDLAIKKIEDQILKYKNKMVSLKKHKGIILKEKSHLVPKVELVEEVYEIIE